MPVKTDRNDARGTDCRQTPVAGPRLLQLLRVLVSPRDQEFQPGRAERSRSHTAPQNKFMSDSASILLPRKRCMEAAIAASRKTIMPRMSCGRARKDSNLRPPDS